MEQKSKYNDWFKSGFYGGLQKISIPIFGVLSTMLLAHKALSKIQMGEWTLFLVVTGFVELIRQALVKTSLIKYINHADEEKHKYVLSAAFFLNTVITLSLALILLLTAGQIASLLHAPELKSMLYIFIPGMLILIPFSHFEWIMYGKSMFKNLMWTYIIRQGSTLLMVLLFLTFSGIGVSLDTLVIFFCLGILAGSIAGSIYVSKVVEKKVALSKDWVKQLWHFGKFVFGSGVSTLVFRNADQFMVSNILANPSFVASQGISLRIINLADIPSQVLGDILFPKSSNSDLKNKPEVIKSYYEKAVGASLCFIIPVILVILIMPKLILLILAGEKYFDAIPYLRTIAVSTIFLAFLKQFGVIIDSTGRPNTNFQTITVIAIIHIALCYFSINYFGFMGAAYALLVSHSIGFVITQYQLYRLFNISWLNCFRYAFKFYPEMFHLFSQRFLLKIKHADL